MFVFHDFTAYKSFFYEEDNVIVEALVCRLDLLSFSSKKLGKISSVILKNPIPLVIHTFEIYSLREGSIKCINKFSCSIRSYPDLIIIRSEEIILLENIFLQGFDNGYIDQAS